MTNRSCVTLFALLVVAAGVAIYSHRSSVGEKLPAGWMTQRLTANQVEQQKRWVYKLHSEFTKLEGQGVGFWEDAFAVADGWRDDKNDPDRKTYAFVSYSGIANRKLRPSLLVIVSKSRKVIVAADVFDPSYL